MLDDARWGDVRDPRDDRRRNHEDALTLSRGPSSAGPRDANAEEAPGHREDDSRTVERGREPRDRNLDLDPREVFMPDLDLPRGADREIVHDARGREYKLRGSESRTLTTVGSFRVVSARDLHDHEGRPAEPRSGDLRHLCEQGLIKIERLDGHRDPVVVLTKEGRDLLESQRRDRLHDHRRAHRQGRPQEFYAGLKKPRELEHDVQVYRAYEREAARLQERGARIERVVLDYELKREYQRWLHEHDRDHDNHCGRPDRDEREIEEWAREHDLPYFDDQVHFPDLRIEYEELDGRRSREDVEVVTVHYRGGHRSATSRSGFSCYSGFSARISGRSGGGRGGGRSGGLAEELWD